MLCFLRPQPDESLWISEVKDFCFRVIPYNVFGLIIYSIQFLRGKIPAEMRRSVSIAIAISWSITALFCILYPMILPPEVTMTYRMIATAIFSFLIMVMGGTLVFNRVNYGFYL